MHGAWLRKREHPTEGAGGGQGLGNRSHGGRLAKELQGHTAQCPHSQGRAERTRRRMEAEPSASTEGTGFAGVCFNSPSALGKDSQDPKQAPTALALALQRPPWRSQHPAQVAFVGLSHPHWGDNWRDQRPEEAIRFSAQSKMTAEKVRPWM